MKGDKVPDAHHVSRYCRGAAIREDGSVDGAAFRLRSGEDYLSVNWLEYLDPANQNVQVSEIRQVLAEKLVIGGNARIAVLSVGELRGHVKRESIDGRLLSVLHEPEEPVDPSHSGIFNMRTEDDLIADLLAQVIRETHPAK